MKRDEVIELADRTTVTGLGYLALLILLGHTTISEMCLICHEDRHTVANRLRALEIRDLAMRAQVGKGFEWFASLKAVSFMRSGDGGIPAITASTTTTALLSSTESEKAAEEAGERGGIPAIKRGDLCAEIPDDLLMAFRRAGIGSNAWQGLAALEWMDVDYVKAHDEYRRSRGDSVGLLITRLRCGDGVPECVEGGGGVGRQWLRVLKRS